MMAIVRPQDPPARQAPPAWLPRPEGGIVRPGVPGDPIPDDCDMERVFAALNLLRPARPPKEGDEAARPATRGAYNYPLAEDPEPQAWPPHGRVVAHAELLEDEPTRQADEDMMPGERRRRTDLRPYPPTRKPSVQVYDRERYGHPNPPPVHRPGWTTDSLVALLQVWAHEHNGRTPTMEEWAAYSQAHPNVPSAHTITRYLGGGANGRWNAAMHRAGLRPNKARPGYRGDMWSEAEEAVAAADLPIKEIARRIGRSPSAVAQRRRHLRRIGVQIVNRRGRGAHGKEWWSPDEESILWDGTADEVAYVLGRTASAVYKRRAIVKLREAA